jgi:integrase
MEQMFYHSRRMIRPSCHLVWHRGDVRRLPFQPACSTIRRPPRAGDASTWARAPSALRVNRAAQRVVGIDGMVLDRGDGLAGQPGRRDGPVRAAGARGRRSPHPPPRLRHTAASLLLAAGVNPKIVQERLGHSSITVPLDLYSPRRSDDAAPRRRTCWPQRSTAE